MKDLLKKKLEDNGYELIKNENTMFKCDDINYVGKGVRIVIFPESEPYHYRIFVDKIDYWNKVSECPIKLPYPINTMQVEELISYIAIVSNLDHSALVPFFTKYYSVPLTKKEKDAFKIYLDKIKLTREAPPK